MNLRAGWRDKVCMHPSGGETVRIKARLRSFYLAALAAATLASAASHAAGMPGCGDVAGDWDGWIAGCAVIIDDTRETAAVRAKALRIRGLAYFRLGAYDDAIADYSRSIGLDAKNTATYVNRAGAYQRKHDFTRAMADYNLAAALDPQEAWVFFDRGKAYQDMRDFAHARQDFDEAIRLKPTVAVFFRRRGDLRKSQGDLAGAGADFDAALRLDPQDVLAYLSRGRLNVDQHNYDRAFADYDKALAAVRPNLPQLVALIYSARAMAADDMGDLPRALREYDAVLKIQPDNAIYLQGRAFTAFAAGDFAAAAAGFGSATQKNPGMFYSVIMRYVARSRMGEHDTPELRRNAEALERNPWPWPLIGLFLGEVTPDQLRTTMAQAAGDEAERRKCEGEFYLAEYDLLHRRRDEAAALMQAAAKSCSHDNFERNAAAAEAKRLAP